jgi:hypothetical protein
VELQRSEEIRRKRKKGDGGQWRGWRRARGRRKTMRWACPITLSFGW